MGRNITQRTFQKYTLVGNGRVARHIKQYLSLLGLPVNQWSRGQNVPLTEILSHSSHVLLLISDSAIEDFVRSHKVLEDYTVVHFSGALSSSLAYSTHPPFAFGPETYPLDVYERIPFVLEKDSPGFEQLLPGLQNPHYEIDPALKPLYHSYCVLSGNFTTLLWQRFCDQLETQFHLPRTIALPYLQSVYTNLQTHDGNALTGPLSRGDTLTIQKNLNALKNDPFQKIYQAFVSSYQEIELLKGKDRNPHHGDL